MRTFILLAFAALCVGADFDTDVKPLFANHCVSCHGPQKQKGGLRLDRRADALKGGENGPVIVAGKPYESDLLKRVCSTDKETAMPPTGERLSAGQVAKLKQWIENGAKWPDDGSSIADPASWWSFKPLVKPAQPTTASNPIDAFIAAKLKEKGLMPVGEADKRTLLRRLAFDLTGLPPTSAEIDSFLNDDSKDAYPILVDRLLDSPAYGERWARHWLDVVHFGETHGYDKDQPRPNAWPYRDYVIRALNADKPYGRFVKEQIAGDILFPGTIDGVEALGFLSAGPWDLIGHAELPESKIDGKIARHLDRDDVVANTVGTFLGLTAHCAQCHNHKFDPISQEDYYRLQAVFAAIDRTDKPYDRDPAVAAKRGGLMEVRRQLEARILDHERGMATELAAIDAKIAKARRPAAPVRPAEHGYHSALAKSPDLVKWVQVELKEAAAIDRIVLKASHDDFNGIGDGFGFPLRYKVELSNDSNFREGVTVLADFSKEDRTNPGLNPVTLKAGGKTGKYIRVTATKLASRLATDYIFALAELEAMDAGGKNLAAGATVTSLDSIEAPVRWRKANLTDGKAPEGPAGMLDDFRRLAQERETLIEKHLDKKQRDDRAAAIRERDRVNGEIRSLPPRSVAYVGAVRNSTGNFAGTGGKPRPIHILARGDVTKPGKEVGPGGITILNGRFDLAEKHDEAERRAALAEWIVDPKNPLTWRVIVNRVWQYHFGRGLVDTPNDFGRMGQLPTHPELLDWLAADFRDGGQSLKKLHKLIVTSDAYRRASTTDAANEFADGDNRFLWRQNRRKLEAEAVRDSILFVSGKLDMKRGGPSFQDFKIKKPEHSPHYLYQLHDPEDPKAHRRAIYRFIVRSKQQPFLASLDCADPSLAVEKRNETITPQQALALLNNQLAVAMSKHFAARLEREAATDEGRVQLAFRLALARSAKVKESELLLEHAKRHGWANACRLVLNLNEFAFVD